MTGELRDRVLEFARKYFRRRRNLGTTAKIWDLCRKSKCEFAYLQYSLAVEEKFGVDLGEEFWAQPSKLRIRDVAEAIGRALQPRVSGAAGRKAT